MTVELEDNLHVSTGDIESHIRDIYDLIVSDTTISRVTDKILLVVKDWQARPLESIEMEHLIWLYL